MIGGGFLYVSINGWPAFISEYVGLDGENIEYGENQEKNLLEKEKQNERVFKENSEETEEIGTSDEQEETEEVIEENIIEKMKEASEISKIVWGAYSKWIDEQDVIQGSYFGVDNWNYKCVIYPDISSIKDFEKLLEIYYTDEQVYDYISNLQYIETDGKLYVAEGDGLGGLGVDEYVINISHDTENFYEIEITSQYVGEEFADPPQKLNYKLTENGWRFDREIIFLEDATLSWFILGGRKE